jgi:hypothetical protein
VKAVLPKLKVTGNQQQAQEISVLFVMVKEPQNRKSKQKIQLPETT